MLRSAARQYAEQTRITELAVRQARRQSVRGTRVVSRLIATYQAESVTLSLGSAAACSPSKASRLPRPATASPQARLLTTPARSAALLDQAATDAAFDRIVAALVNDAGRTASLVDVGRRPAVTGYVRSLNPPSCSRCAVLAGRVYRYSTGFQRHPRCDCLMTPTTRPPVAPGHRPVRGVPAAAGSAASRKPTPKPYTPARTLARSSTCADPLPADGRLVGRRAARPPHTPRAARSSATTATTSSGCCRLHRYLTPDLRPRDAVGHRSPARGLRNHQESPAMGHTMKFHPHTGAPIVPIWIRPDGRAMWPILGASPDDPPTPAPARHLCRRLCRPRHPPDLHPTPTPTHARPSTRPRPRRRADARPTPDDEPLGEPGKKALEAEREARRNAEKALTDAQAKQQLTLDGIAKALGLKADEPPDPEKLAAQVTEEQGKARDAQVQLAVYRNAGAPRRTRTCSSTRARSVTLEGRRPDRRGRDDRRPSRRSSRPTPPSRQPPTPPFPGGPRPPAPTGAGSLGEAIASKIASRPR
jgi:hypothetical protein